MSPETCAIREAFRRSGWTQAQLAARAERSPRVVWAILQGRDVKASSVFAVSRALGLVTIQAPAAHFASSRELHS